MGTISLMQFTDRILGDVLDDLVDRDSLGPDWLQPYVRVDVDAYARDLSSELWVSGTFSNTKRPSARRCH